MAARIIQLKASSLMETLVSMVVILIVFGIGMMIFVNLTKASRTEIRKNTNELMVAWSFELENNGFENNMYGELHQDSIKLIYKLSELLEYPDRQRLVIYSIQPNTGMAIDSLVRYIDNKIDVEQP